VGLTPGDRARARHLKQELRVATDPTVAASCDNVLLYLTSLTWTRGEESDALGQEVAKAMDAGVHVLLAHEMVGLGGQEARSGCDFGSLFSSSEGATPDYLLQRGVYSEIATPVRGGAWRQTSMHLMCLALGMSNEELDEESSLQLSIQKSLSMPRLSKWLKDARQTSRHLRVWRSGQGQMREVEKSPGQEISTTSASAASETV